MRPAIPAEGAGLARTNRTGATEVAATRAGLARTQARMPGLVHRVQPATIAHLAAWVLSTPAQLGDTAAGQAAHPAATARRGTTVLTRHRALRLRTSALQGDGHLRVPPRARIAQLAGTAQQGLPPPLAPAHAQRVRTRQRGQTRAQAARQAATRRHPGRALALATAPLVGTASPQLGLRLHRATARAPRAIIALRGPLPPRSMPVAPPRRTARPARVRLLGCPQATLPQAAPRPRARHRPLVRVARESTARVAKSCPAAPGGTARLPDFRRPLATAHARAATTARPGPRRNTQANAAVLQCTARQERGRRSLCRRASTRDH